MFLLNLEIKVVHYDHFFFNILLEVLMKLFGKTNAKKPISLKSNKEK